MTKTVLSALLLFALYGCAPVPAYMRGHLMQRCMQTKPSLDGAFDEHVAELRESAVGASAGENASCGCR